MADDEDTTLRKLYQKASSINGYPHFSFVGPFGQRVSFASQQRRALNTVWATHPQLAGKKAPSVAVVGGGIAGLTTAAALLVKGCRVTLFERDVQFAGAQLRASHRYAHPTVNFWPEKSVDSTTDFPFLEWHADHCHKVAGMIVDEWRRTFADDLMKCLMETTVTAIASVGEQAEVIFEQVVGNGRKKPGAARFDHVFVTTGFGVEAKLFESDRAYWEPDGLENRLVNGSKKFVVGGTGDGGLIEVLRILQKDFEFGRLTLKLIGMLEEASLTDDVKDIEQKVMSESLNSDQAAVAYSEQYGDLAENLTVRIDRVMKSRHDDLSVTLVGRLPQPFQRNVAPVHKLMVAHALRCGALTYVQGEIRAAADGSSCVIVTAEGERDIDPDANVVVRIGPKHPLGGLLPSEAVETLRHQQQEVADFLAPAPIDRTFFSKPRVAPIRGSAEHALSRHELAAAFMAREFKSGIKVSDESGTPFFTTTERCELELPNSLFGIPLRAGNILTARHL